MAILDTTREILARVTDPHLADDPNLDRDDAKRLRVSNVVRRTFAILFGWDGYQARRVVCDKRGALQTSPAPVAQGDLHFWRATATTETTLVEENPDRTRLWIRCEGSQSAVIENPSFTSENDYLQLDQGQEVDLGAFVGELNFRSGDGQTEAIVTVMEWSRSPE